MTQPPDDLPVSLEDMRLYLRVDHSADDTLIASLIRTAASLCETYTGLALIERAYTLTVDSWPGAGTRGWWDGVRDGARINTRAPMTLPMPPLRAVQEIRIYNGYDSYATLAAAHYIADTTGLPGRIVLKDSAAVTPDIQTAGIKIDFTAGYGTLPEHIPAAIAQAVKLIVAHLYQNRGDESVALDRSGAQTLLQPFRMMRLA